MDKERGIVTDFNPTREAVGVKITPFIITSLVRAQKVAVGTESEKQEQLLQKPG